MSTGKIIAITAIDTDMGKTLTTGLLARFLLSKGYRVITQKICQTGAQGDIAPDIIVHRQLMGIDLTAEDISGLTCPYLFSEPCSPHLAAQLENRTIDCSRIHAATQQLAEIYDIVLLEGAGGLMVPLRPDFTLADYLQHYQHEQILVSCARLGSINHTLATLEVMRNRGLHLRGIIYNRFMDDNELIATDSRACFLRYLQHYGYPPHLVDLPDMNDPHGVTPDFSSLFIDLG